MKSPSNTVPASGLLAWLNDTRIALPLKGVEARFEVRGDLVSVELCQIYHQSHREPLDVLYTFPLPGGAAVYCCEMTVNDRVISAKVMEQEEARRVAAEKKAAGHRTALVESVRENLFELALGNLAPGDTVVIRLAWFQTLDTTGHDRSFLIPFTPGVRYIPGTPLLRSNTGRGTADDTDQVPDASRLSPPRMDQFHPDAAWVSVEGCIQLEGVDAAHIASPSHTLLLREAGGAVTARLAGNGEVPNRDFVLRLPAASPDVLTPVAWMTPEEHQTHALVRIIAPATAPATLTARDVYFLVDRSGSMSGQKWTATCGAFRAFLGRLAPQDRAWVTFFESQYLDLAEKPMPPAAILAEPVVQQLESWGVAGGTELLPALDHVLEALSRHSAQRNPVIVLITDGQVGNEETIIQRMGAHPQVRVFCYGIDTAVNDAFLRRLAARQRGACQLATPEEDFAGHIVSLASRLRHPVLTDLQPPAGWMLPGGAIPDLYAGEYLTVPLRATEPGGGAEALTFTGRDGAGAAATLTCPVRPSNDPAISRLWARERIASLLAEDRREEAIALSVSANIICTYTAFIAWDESERLALHGPNPEVYQPVIERDMLYAPAAGMPRPAAVRKKLRKIEGLAKCIPPALRAEPTDAELHEECGLAMAGISPAAAPPPAPCAPAPAPGGLDGAILSKTVHPVPFDMDSFPSECRCAVDPDSPVDEDEFVYRPRVSSLIRGGNAPSWRDRFTALTNIAVSGALLDWLEQWLWAVPAEVNDRRRELEALAGALATSGTPAVTLAAWITAHLDQALREPALRELRAFAGV